MTLYIAYGSNLNPGQMAFRCKSAKPVGPSVLRGYRLLFRGSNNYAVATVEPHRGSSVPVLIWELQPEDEAALDVYEGFPTHYRKETVRVMHDEKMTDVMIYIMNDGRPLGLPGKRYLKIIEEGYAATGFDSRVLSDALRLSGGR